MLPGGMLVAALTKCVATKGGKELSTMIENTPQQTPGQPPPQHAEHAAATPSGTASRGFASMTPERQREIAKKGGAAVSRNRDYMASIGRIGGERVSQNREHMAGIGRRGGQRVSQNREHMARIGRKGGAAVSQDRQHMAQIGRKGGES
jgi:hypothetical protein